MSRRWFPKANAVDVSSLLTYSSCSIKSTRISVTGAKVERKASKHVAPSTEHAVTPTPISASKIPAEHAYTDGACSIRGNLSWAGSGVYFPATPSKNISEILPSTIHNKATSQRAELYAALRAIQLSDATMSLYIHTDSKYLKDGMAIQQNGLEACAKYVTNSDLWQELRDERMKREHSVHFVKVKAHSGIVGNEAADKLAKHAVILAKKQAAFML